MYTEKLNSTNVPWRAQGVRSGSLSGLTPREWGAKWVTTEWLSTTSWHRTPEWTFARGWVAQNNGGVPERKTTAIWPEA